MYYTFVVVGADNADASYEDIKPSVQDDEFLEPISLVQDKRNDDTKPPVQDDLYIEPTPPVQDDQYYIDMTLPVKDQVYESMDEDVWKFKPLLLLLNGMTL